MTAFFSNYVIGSDHAGFKLKELIKSYLSQNFPNIKIIDVGTNNDDSCDFPDYANAVAEQLKLDNDNTTLGILICGTGIGMSMAVNRHRHIRGALIHNELTAHFARNHSNANVLILGSKVVNYDLAVKCINEFLNTDFDKTSPRHQRRLEKIS